MTQDDLDDIRQFVLASDAAKDADKRKRRNQDIAAVLVAILIATAIVVLSGGGR